MPTLLAKMIDNGIAVNDFGEVKYYGMIMIAICLIGLVALMFLAYCGSKITTSIVRDIRDDIFEKTQSFSHREYDQFVCVFVGN